MSDDFCVEHGYEFMRCEKVWGAIPYCEKCEERMQEDAYAMTVPNLRRRASAVYLSCDEAVAKDISSALLWAADEIERLSAGSAAR